MNLDTIKSLPTETNDQRDQTKWCKVSSRFCNSQKLGWPIKYGKPRPAKNGELIISRNYIENRRNDNSALNQTGRLSNLLSSKMIKEIITFLDIPYVKEQQKGDIFYKEQRISRHEKCEYNFWQST